MPSLSCVVVLGSLVSLSCQTESRAPAGVIGVTATAVQVGDEVRFYLGQPGVDKDIAKIESGELLPYHWTRIAVPVGKVPTIDSGAVSFDFAASPDISFWQFFRLALGCVDYPNPWVSRWQGGQPGVSGTLDVVRSSSGYTVGFDFYYSGVLETPCGTFETQYSFSNKHAGGVPLPERQ